MLCCAIKKIVQIYGSKVFKSFFNVIIYNSVLIKIKVAYIFMPTWHDSGIFIKKSRFLGLTIINTSYAFSLQNKSTCIIVGIRLKSMNVVLLIRGLK